MVDVRRRTREYVQRLDRARATLRDDVERDGAPVRGLSLTERGEWLARACASAGAILAARTDRAAILARREPPAPDFEVKWQALMERRRRARS